MKEKKIILYLGQKEIGERCFLILFELWKSGEIELIVSSNISRNVWWQSNKIYEICCENSIPFFSNEKRDDEIINDFIKMYDVNQIISVQHIGY